MRELTLILPYYLNPQMFLRQQQAWAVLPADVRAQLHVIVVDDGSPTTPAKDYVTEAGLASFRLYRTLVDVRWNWLFCRNLGVDQASTEWVLLTDMDHQAPEQTLRRVMSGKLDDATVYRFSRVDAPDLTPYTPHPNSWLMTRKRFDRIGGYDELFSGHYGTDGEFRDRVTQRSKQVELLPQPLIRVPREVVPDASTTTYGRREAVDKRVRALRTQREQTHNWETKRLTFPWERVI